LSGAKNERSKTNGTDGGVDGSLILILFQCIVLWLGIRAAVGVYSSATLNSLKNVPN